MKKKIILALLILAVVGGTAFPFDIHSFPSPIVQNSILISPAFNLGSAGFSGYNYGWNPPLALGLTAGFDYALPIPAAIAVGLETGFGTTTEDGFDTFAIPLLTRVSWHPNFEVRGLDPYVILKLGYSIGVGTGANGGFSWGTDVGCRYFFNDSIGIFGELGYDRYKLGEASLGWLGSYSWYLYTWFHVGVTFKIGGGNGGSSSASSSRSQPQSGHYMLVNSDTLNVRSGPSADYSLVGALPRNTRVEVIDKSSTWWKIKSGNIEGYVNSSFLSEEK